MAQLLSIWCSNDWMLTYPSFEYVTASLMPTLRHIIDVRYKSQSGSRWNTIATLNRIVSIVDDDEDIVYLFRDALKDLEGFSVFGFTDPILALRHFKRKESMYALVLSDYRMPGMNGMELIKKIKDRDQSVQTILMTAFETDGNLIQDYMAKNIINGFLQKPVRIENLRQEINNHLPIPKLIWIIL